MAKLTDYVTYADAHRYFSKEALWDLFDGDRERLNIAHECLDRHDRGRVAIRIAHGEGGSETYTFAELSDLSSQFANWLTKRGVAKGERVAIMLEPSLEFYAALIGTMK
ncbi:MAG: AMP-binding protein, partial [Alphaproteobacteria bacterium]|nr:AMP-binding protein [Alphaproteobacteria bacterium]